MNKILIVIKSAFIMLALGFLSKTQAGTNILSCGLGINQQQQGGLPDFSNSAPLQGVQCQHIPYRSGFLGNWFPSLPELSVSQSRRILSRSTDSKYKPENDDYSQSWKLAIAIKRLRQSQISIFAGQSTWQQTLRAKDSVLFIPASTSNISSGIAINQQQKTRFNREENNIGLSIVLPYQTEQKLTELRLQYTTIEHPLQANVPSFEKHSLFIAKTRIHELLIMNQSDHRGLNINWQFGMGKGEVKLQPKNLIKVDSELNQATSLRAQLELYYQYRINRRWFSHVGWQADIHYWQQNIKNNDYTFANTNTLSQQVFFGMGIRF